MTQVYIPGAVSVAIRCKNGVVLGNDNRVIWGYTVTNANTKKVFALTDNIGMTCYGLVGDFQTIVKMMKAQANLFLLREEKSISCKAMAKMIANYLYQQKMAPFYINVAIAGVDNGIPQVWTLDSIGSLIPDDYGVGGTGSAMAVGILEAEYKPSLTVAQGEKLVEKCIRAAIKRDAFTGNGIDILTITDDGPKEKSIILKELGE
ncbi:MAG: proteasome subunit beta [Promethearchaeota archaeon]